MTKRTILFIILLSSFGGLKPQSNYIGDKGLNDLPHGKGIMFWGDTLKFEGSFVEGLPFGSGTITSRQSVNEFIYVGDIVGKRMNDGLVEIFMNGSGVSTWSNGNKYEGEFSMGKRSGKGVFVWSNGEKYEGQFVNGIQSGKGKYSWSSGDIYEGNYKDGRQTGKGKYTWASGDTYEGDFMDDIRVGFGKYTWANGDVYEGDFVDGKRHGKGVFVWKHGDKYEGDFINGKRTGKGTFLSRTGEKYEGDFVNGKRTGKGVLVKSNGEIIEGNFHNDEIEEVYQQNRAKQNDAIDTTLQNKTVADNIDNYDLTANAEQNPSNDNLDNKDNRETSIIKPLENKNDISKSETIIITSNLSENNSCLLYVTYCDDSKANNVLITLELIDKDNSIVSKYFTTDEEGFVTLQWTKDQSTSSISAKKEKYMANYKNNLEYILKLKSEPVSK